MLSPHTHLALHQQRTEQYLAEVAADRLAAQVPRTRRHPARRLARRLRHRGAHDLAA